MITEQPIALDIAVSRGPIILLATALLLLAQNPNPRPPAPAVNVVRPHANEAAGPPGLTVVTANAGWIVCTVTNPQPQIVRVVCSEHGTAQHTYDIPLSVGPRSIGGHYASGEDKITWEVSEPTAGVVQWTVTADWVSRSERF